MTCLHRGAHGVRLCSTGDATEDAPNQRRSRLRLVTLDSRKGSRHFDGGRRPGLHRARYRVGRGRSLGVRRGGRSLRRRIPRLGSWRRETFVSGGRLEGWCNGWESRLARHGSRRRDQRTTTAHLEPGWRDITLHGALNWRRARLRRRGGRPGRRAVQLQWPWSVVRGSGKGLSRTWLGRDGCRRLGGACSLAAKDSSDERRQRHRRIGRFRASRLDRRARTGRGLCGGLAARSAQHGGGRGLARRRLFLVGGVARNHRRRWRRRGEVRRLEPPSFGGFRRHRGNRVRGASQLRPFCSSRHRERRTRTRERRACGRTAHGLRPRVEQPEDTAYERDARLRCSRCPNDGRFDVARLATIRRTDGLLKACQRGGRRRLEREHRSQPSGRLERLAQCWERLGCGQGARDSHARGAALGLTQQRDAWRPSEACPHLWHVGVVTPRAGHGQPVDAALCIAVPVLGREDLRRRPIGAIGGCRVIHWGSARRARTRVSRWRRRWTSR